MKALILYGSSKKLTNAHKLVTGRLQPKFYVRAKIVSGDCDAAMAKVKCMPGENLLNTQDIEEPMPPNPKRKPRN
jgi:hypothetical protein